jgi:hypothetical protein
MNSQDISVIIQALAGLFLIYISFRKAPAERANLNGGTAKTWSEAANLAREEADREHNKRLAAEAERDKISEDMVKLQDRLGMNHRNHYLVTFHLLAAGENPTIEDVIVEPVDEIVEGPGEINFKPKKK